MYAPSETQVSASESERRQMDQGESLYGFRPLALPALAAAAGRPKKQERWPAAPATGRQGILSLVHEDEPLA
jgi:hypothetical protein